MVTILVVVNNQYDKEKGYRVFSANEGIIGLIPTNRFAGHDFEAASQWVSDHNTKMGISKTKQAQIISRVLGMQHGHQV